MLFRSGGGFHLLDAFLIQMFIVIMTPVLSSLFTIGLWAVTPSYMLCSN